MDIAEYCRQIEAHLCRRNDGHLIRIVGPAFERVCGWEKMGIPLKIALRGIDQSCERYYSKGPRRRPIRIEYCEADILDLFDRWRRAVGVPSSAMPGEPGAETEDATIRRREGLARHVDHVLERLTRLRAGWPLPDELAAHVDRLIGVLGGRRSELRGLRGEARARLLAWLEEEDRTLVSAARRVTAPATLEGFQQEAEEELKPFRARMSPEVWTRAVGSATDRVLREHFGLPRVAWD